VEDRDSKVRVQICEIDDIRAAAKGAERGGASRWTWAEEKEEAMTQGDKEIRIGEEWDREER